MPEGARTQRRAHRDGQHLECCSVLISRTPPPKPERCYFTAALCALSVPLPPRHPPRLVEQLYASFASVANWGSGLVRRSWPIYMSLLHNPLLRIVPWQAALTLGIKAPQLPWGLKF